MSFGRFLTPFGRLSRFRPRYTLRFLILLLLVATGGLAWWRQPFEVEVEITPPIRFVCGSCRDRDEDDGYRREVRTVRRVLFGEPVQDGLTIAYDRQGRRRAESHWCDGIRHGPSREWSSSGQVTVEEYAAGKLRRRVTSPGGGKRNKVEEFDAYGLWQLVEFRSPQDDALRQQTPCADGQYHGVARAWYDNNRMWYEAHWEHDRLEGRYRSWDADGRLVHDLTFKDHYLVKVGEEPVNNDIARGVPNGQWPDRGVFEQLQKISWSNLGGESLADLPRALTYRSYLEFRLDRPALEARGVTGELKITSLDGDGIPWSAAVTLLLRPHSLTCAYRYGCLWITTPHGRDHWVDTTGIESLQPNPNSSWGRAWLDPISLELVETPLEYLGLIISDKYELTLKVDEAAFRAAGRDEMTLTFSTSGAAIKDAIGALCYENNLCCALENDVLVVRPAASGKANDTSPTR